MVVAEEGTIGPGRSYDGLAMKRLSSSLLLASVVAVSCSKGTSSSPAPLPPVVDAIGWATGASEAANGPAPAVDLGSACGSTQATFLAELVNGNPLQAQVLREWGDCVSGGKDVMVAGRVTATHLGPTDLPMDHPFADDLSMDVDLDEQYVPFNQKLGTEPSEEGGDSEASMHVEISAGFIPHLPSTSTPPAGETVRQAADANLAVAGFQPGFTGPAVGDRIIAMGRWIIDCGHASFTAEIHTMSFLAWTHVDSAGHATARFFYNPYRDTELYAAMTPAQLGAVDDTSRLANAQPFPRYFVQEILGLDPGSTDRLRALELIEATHVSPVDWEICLPEGSGALTVNYDVVARTGAAVTFTPDSAHGCVAMHSVLGTYTAAPANVRVCSLPWSYLDSIVQGAVSQPIDLQSVIGQYVTTPAGQARLALDPEATCADALAGPPVTDAPTGQSVRVDDTQPFPFYGTVTLARAQ
jgi:hypothetical protein